MRLRFFPAFVALFLVVTVSASATRAADWHAINITGSVPKLQFHFLRANDGRDVTAADYRGDVVLLYFGYTNCPDVCPTTLANLAEMLRKLGKDAAHVRVLFVSVDPGRDRPAVLKAYVHAFAPQMDGLLGGRDEVAIVARRYRVAYTVRPATKGHPYEVNHSSAVFIFDGTGRARLVTLKTDDTAGLAADVERLLRSPS